MYGSKTLFSYLHHYVFIRVQEWIRMGTFSHIHLISAYHPKQWHGDEHLINSSSDFKGRTSSQYPHRDVMRYFHYLRLGTVNWHSEMIVPIWKYFQKRVRNRTPNHWLLPEPCRATYWLLSSQHRLYWEPGFYCKLSSSNEFSRKDAGFCHTCILNIFRFQVWSC